MGLYRRFDSFVLVAIAGLLTAPSASAQLQARGSVLFESYNFDSGLSLAGGEQLSRLTQFTLPITVTYPIGQLASVTVSTAYTRVELESEMNGVSDTRSVTGLTDVEARVSVELIPQRLTAFATGALPAGNETLEAQLRPLANLLATEALSFSARSLGTGGNVGLGLAGAMPAGDFAVGFATSVTQFGSFEPVLNQASEFKPGMELRARLGFEGPLSPRSYLRLAGIFSHRGADELAARPLGASGNRYAAYASLNHGLENAALTVYLLDSFRASSQIEDGSLQPRGNLLALGAQISVPLDRVTSIVPRIEMRRSNLAVTQDSDELSSVGSTFRLGADASRRLNDAVSLVLDLDAVFGSLNQGAVQSSGLDGSTPLDDVSVRGFKFGVHIEVRR